MPRGFIKKTTMQKGKSTFPKRKKIEIVRTVAEPKLSSAQRKEVKKLISVQQEHKFFDTTNSTTVNYNGSIIELSLVPQGDTDQTRDSDMLMPTSLECKFEMTVADQTNLMRMIIFRWIPQNTAPTLNTLLESIGSATGGPFSPFKHDWRDQFNVLYDKTFTLGTAAVTSNQVVYQDFVLPLAKKPMHFANGTTVGSNKIYLLTISDSAAIAHPGLLYYFRLNFTDS